MRNFKALTYVAVITLACSYGTAWASTAATQNSAPTATAQTLNHQTILTHLLKADLAMQRNMPEVALDNYLIVAQYTRDPQVAQHATELAIQIQAAGKAVQAAEIWAAAAPDDLQAQLIASTLLLGSDSNKAQIFLNRAFDINNPEIDQHLLLILNQLTPEGQKALSQLIYNTAAQRKNDAMAQLAAAQVAAAMMDVNKAVEQVKLALKIQPSLTGAIELNAKIISYQSKDDKAALTYLEQQVKKFPQNAELRFFYVSALLDNDQTERALPNLTLLTKNAELGGEAYLMMGEIYIGREKLPLATQTIEKALAFPNSQDKARFYLGQLAEYRKDNINALKWYEGVSENSELQAQAYLRAATIYANAGNYDDALSVLQNANPVSFEDQKQILLTEIDIRVSSNDLEKALDSSNKVLSVIPEDVDFLYARSIIFGMQNNLDASEKDLRTILKLEPNNANALNALGFTLSNQPTRMKEAEPLLTQALSQNPDNPAFMDSMGWWLYKMGRTQEAITMLNKAYKLSGDSEVAAHLGEVLWTSGNKEAAKKVWLQGLNDSQNDGAIQETLQRLNIPATDLQSSKAANLH